jgi:hypothetical protein
VWHANRQREVDMFAGLMTVLHRAWFQGKFEPQMFGGSAPGPARPEDVFGRQTWQEKRSIIRSHFRALDPKVIEKNRQRLANGG